MRAYLIEFLKIKNNLIELLHTFTFVVFKTLLSEILLKCYFLIDFIVNEKVDILHLLRFRYTITKPFPLVNVNIRINMSSDEFSDNFLFIQT